MIDVIDLLIGFILGIIASVIATYWVTWLWRPKVKDGGFKKEDFNLGGKLFKLQFTLKGRSAPGTCCLEIRWQKNKVLNKVFAKWDETPNPSTDDTPNGFQPSMVPATYYQPLIPGRGYAVPILIEQDGGYEIYSGWWWGKNKGYGPDPKVTKGTVITITLTGNSLNWSRVLTVGDILARAA
jgi:hypothetical protein